MEQLESSQIFFIIELICVIVTHHLGLEHVFVNYNRVSQSSFLEFKLEWLFILSKIATSLKISTCFPNNEIPFQNTSDLSVAVFGGNNVLNRVVRFRNASLLVAPSIDGLDRTSGQECRKLGVRPGLIAKLENDLRNMLFEF